MHAYILLWWLVIQCIQITIINIAVVKIINWFFITENTKQVTMLGIYYPTITNTQHWLKENQKAMQPSIPSKSLKQKLWFKVIIKINSESVKWVTGIDGKHKSKTRLGILCKALAHKRKWVRKREAFMFFWKEMRQNNLGIDRQVFLSLLITNASSTSCFLGGHSH